MQESSVLPSETPSPADEARAEPVPGGRVLSVDLLRGCDVLLMLFVNEIAGVRGTPAFLLHRPHDADGMTVTDLVFPAFLFILGMAIPLALGGRIRRGESPAALWRHVLSRTLALIVIGVFMVNAEEASGADVPSAPAWNLLMTVAVMLAWGAPAPEGRRWRAMRSLGIVLLVISALAYQNPGVAGWVQLRPHWWGILGLIGWAYLVAAAVYILAGDRLAVLVGSIGLLYCLYLADEAGGWLRALQPYLRVGRVLGSHAAVVLSGTVLGVMALRQQRTEGPRGRLVAQALGYGAALLAAGILLHTLRGLHPAFWINKVMATAPWSLVCSALTCGAWVVVFVLVDVVGWRRWPRAVHLAGENALVAYLMAPFLLSLFALSAPLFRGTNPYEALGQSVAPGFIRSAVFAWVVVRLCGGLRSRGISMRL